MHALLLSLSTLTLNVGALIYVISILRGRTKPHRVTRFVLFFILALNFISVLAAHGNLGAELYAGIILVNAAIFLLLCVKRGMGGSSLFDWACLIIAFCGVIGWQLSGNSLLSIWLAAIADFVAYLPAIAKTWQHPNTESPWLYILGTIGTGLGLFAYKLSTVSIFQISTIISALIMIFCIYHKKIPRYKFKQ
jgi:hypothetical protein